MVTTAIRVPDHRIVDDQTVKKIVRLVHKRTRGHLPANFGPRTTPVTFDIWLKRLGLQLKSSFLSN